MMMMMIMMMIMMIIVMFFGLVNRVKDNHPNQRLLHQVMLL